MANQTELKPVDASDLVSRKLKAEIVRILKTTFFDPLAAQLELTRDNAAPTKTALLRKIESGDIQYMGDGFIGKFDAQASKQLREMGATFNKSQRKWVIGRQRLTTPLKRAVTKQIADRETLAKRAREVLARVDTSAKQMIANLSFDAFALGNEQEIDAKLRASMADALAVQPQLTDDQKKQLRAEYTENVKLSIAGFVDDEVKRFRKSLLPEIQAGVGRGALTEYVQKRLKVGITRAQFIARQETALFTSKQKQLQYQDVGIETYRWKAIGGKRGDGRTRDEHRQAHGKIFFWDQSKNKNPVRNGDGQPVHPGQDFGCRCQAVPIVDSI